MLSGAGITGLHQICEAYDNFILYITKLFIGCLQVVFLQIHSNTVVQIGNKTLHTVQSIAISLISAAVGKDCCVSVNLLLVMQTGYYKRSGLGKKGGPVRNQFSRLDWETFIIIQIIKTEFGIHDRGKHQIVRRFQMILYIKIRIGADISVKWDIVT